MKKLLGVLFVAMLIAASTLTVKEKARAEKPGEQGIFGSRTKERMLHVKRSG
jgi:hypothetical protein